jgi:hypothetical protein
MAERVVARNSRELAQQPPQERVWLRHANAKPKEPNSGAARWQTSRRKFALPPQSSSTPPPA